MKTEAVKTFILSIEMSYQYGLIGLNEVIEREHALRWLLGDSEDPRCNAIRSEDSKKESIPKEGEPQSEKFEGDASDPGIIHLIPLGLPDRWVFTLGDEDSFPSIPHGHLGKKTRPFPKLNPYTGRAFSRKDVEDNSLRLSRSSMIVLWNNQDFRQLCLAQISWYLTEHPYFEFPVRNPMKLPRWRRR